MSTVATDPIGTGPNNFCLLGDFRLVRLAMIDGHGVEAR